MSRISHLTPVLEPVEAVSQGQGLVLTSVDPSTLVLGVNARQVVDLDEAFVASVREHGVLVPVVVYRDGDARLVVKFGQRRTTAAVRVGLSSIPVLIAPTDSEAGRIVQQLAENDHRAGLSTSDHVAAFEQLSMLGLSAAEIAKMTAIDEGSVSAGLRVASSSRAKAKATEVPGLTLSQAAAIAEVEDDPADAARIEEVISHGWNIDHEIRRIRDRRTEEAALAARVKELEDAGETVVPYPSWDEKKVTVIDRLYSGGKHLTPAKHRTCPHRAVAVRPYAPYKVEEVCTNPHAARHETASGTVAGKASKADLTEEEQAAAAADRRDVIESNKAWASAEVVRREWLAEFATRTAPPKTFGAFLAHVANAPNLIGWESLASDLLGAAHKTYQNDTIGKAITSAKTEQRAQQIALVLAVAMAEKSLTKNSWRVPTTINRVYFEALESWGYGLAEIEKRAMRGGRK